MQIPVQVRLRNDACRQVSDPCGFIPRTKATMPDLAVAVPSQIFVFEMDVLKVRDEGKYCNQQISRCYGHVPTRNDQVGNLVDSSQGFQSPECTFAFDKVASFLTIRQEGAKGQAQESPGEFIGPFRAYRFTWG